MSALHIDPEWLWLIGGVVLLIAELIAPGFFLVFIGGAAIVTGVAALLLPIGVAVQLALFAAVAFVAARVGGRRAYSMRYDYSTDPLLNDRARRLLGKVVVATAPSRSGRTRSGASAFEGRGSHGRACIHPASPRRGR